MAIGVVSDSDFEAELAKSLPVGKAITGEVVDSPTKGRGKDNVAVPESLQKIIGETSQLDGRAAALDLAAMYGIKPSSVSAYANGASSTTSYDTPKKEIAGHIEKVKARIAKTARGKLNYALSQITEEKFAEAKLRDVTGAARDLSAIVKEMEPSRSNSEVEGTSKVNFVIYAPQFRNENHFESVSVNE
jgi:hypothetical protein